MPVEIKFDDTELNNFLDQSEDDAFELIGEFLRGEMAKRAPKDSTFLMGQIDYKIMSNPRFLRMITNTEYAAIQELGGDIQPVKAKSLAIPVHEKAKGKKPEDFDNLVLLERDGRAPVLFRTVGSRKKKIEILFVLVKKVTIPAQPYMRPAVIENKDKIMELFASGHRTNTK